MTNHELDAMMKRILVDSISQDCEAMDQDGNLAFQPSARHQRQIRLMLKDPLGWARKKARPMWKTIAQRAAVVLLIISLSSLFINLPFSFLQHILLIYSLL